MGRSCSIDLYMAIRRVGKKTEKYRRDLEIVQNEKMEFNGIKTGLWHGKT